MQHRKVKLSLQRVEDPTFSRQTAHKMAVILSSLHTHRSLPPEIFQYSFLLQAE
jgi:hypothetical protein